VCERSIDNPQLVADRGLPLIRARPSNRVREQHSRQREARVRPQAVRGGHIPGCVFLAVVFWVAREARRHADAWVAGAVVGLAFFVVALGNLRVIWTIGGDSWTDAQAGTLGSARPGFDSGHSLVEIGTTAGVAAMVLFIAVLRTHRIVRTGPAIAAAALSLLPLIAPGIGPLGLLGIVVLVADLCIQRAHQLKMAATPV
jgi:hypothetical protein